MVQSSQNEIESHRVRKERSKYYTWNEISMKLAIEALRKKEIGLNAASRIYSVPKTTLRRRLLEGNKKAKEHKQIKGFECDLTSEAEVALVEHILEMESCLFGYTPLDVRILAFQFAEKYGLSHRFNINNKMAGKKWYYNFMKRSPELSLCQPRATSFNRATGFNKEVVNEFFNKLIEVTDKHGITEARQIFNVDETGISTVQRRPRNPC
ncbi:hypothetical protein DMN91_005576 [Ooceraea biroi]|uniref:HTH psq-type domain-containing protein n=1 Tax=Ooceraea biroi TaxID=2015173 RepID=A0A3L8DLV9_OOCBI|nr:hypothetical protein DMN91_005576 [Ooceraea biroi]